MSHIGPRGDKIWCEQAISDVQTDGQREGQTNHYWAPAERGPNYLIQM